MVNKILNIFNVFNTSTNEGKIAEQEQEIRELKAQINSKIKIQAKFKNVSVNFEFPEMFIRLNDKLGSGRIHWRAYRVNPAKNILSADSRWEGPCSVSTHKHEDSYEIIQSVHGEGYCTTYTDEGQEIETVHIKEGDTYNINPGINHFVYCKNDWDFIVKYKKIKK
jgi:quercetin dioxygenase-like cupin family protein